MVFLAFYADFCLCPQISDYHHLKQLILSSVQMSHTYLKCAGKIIILTKLRLFHTFKHLVVLTYRLFFYIVFVFKAVNLKLCTDIIAILKCAPVFEQKKNVSLKKEKKPLPKFTRFGWNRMSRLCDQLFRILMSNVFFYYRF